MQSLDLSVELTAFEKWLSSIEARFSVQIDESRHGAFKVAIESYFESMKESLDSMEPLARSGLMDAEHWAMILHLATNHETRFFRSQAAINQIVEICTDLRSPKILSVGCSSGEEPYSIASALLDAGHGTFQIHGTDVSSVCIETARTGIYDLHPAITTKAAAPALGRRMRFHAWLRSMVTFEQHNILQNRPVQLSKPNIAITQNMLIYYRLEARYEILNRLAAMLDVGGYLITAAAETQGWSAPGMERVPNKNLNVFVRSEDV